MKTIVLAEFSWCGHHPTFFKVYTRALLELGLNVLALCPQPEEVLQWLADQKVEGLDRLRIHRFFDVQKLPLPGSRLRSFVGSILALTETTRFIRHPKLNPFGEPSLVIFSCIYSPKWIFPALADRLLPYRWTCLLLQATTILGRWKNDGWRQKSVVLDRLTLLRAKHCRAVLTLNETITEELSQALGGKSVVAIPDVTDTTAPNCESPLAEEIRDRAKGRKIIGVLGHLCRDRCHTLLDAARSLDPSRYFFVLAGPLFIDPKQSDAAEVQAWLEHPALKQENVFLHRARIQDGACYNGVVSMVHVQVMAYRDFPESSNNMVKAALFRKPIIVSRGHLMEVRVRKFRLGEAISQGDALGCVNAIERLADPGWPSQHLPAFEDFVREHSEERLREIFGGLIGPEARSNVNLQNA